MRRRLGDERRAEARFAVTLVLIVLALTLAQFLGWALLAPVVRAAPTGPVAVAFWGGQVGTAALCFFCCVLGFKPAVTIRWEPGGLLISRPQEALRLSPGEIVSHEILSPLAFHRHYRRYARTHVFVNRPVPAPLLLQTPFGPVVLGLADADREALLALLTRADAPAGLNLTPVAGPA